MSQNQLASLQKEKENRKGKLYNLNIDLKRTVFILNKWHKGYSTHRQVVKSVNLPLLSEKRNTCNEYVCTYMYSIL
jgi:hypothetical protein